MAFDFDGYGEYIFFDGAMGTMLQKYGLEPGGKPDLMNMTHPDAVESVHRMYIEAGSDIICTNTFGANALGLKGTGYTPTDIITAAVQIAKRAPHSTLHTQFRNETVHTSTLPLVALDIGSIGEILEPAGELSFEEAYKLFQEMAVAGELAGADLAAIETMSDAEELRAAMTAIGDNTSLPIFATMTFEKSGYTYMGCTPEKFVETAESLGAAAIGLNCSLEPQEMLQTAKRIAAVTKLPMIIKPNAGLPDAVSGEYHTDAKEFAKQMLPYKELGVKIIGGCCGTTPEHIRELKKAFS